MLKHTGRLKGNQRKVVVAYKVVPGEPENCICITTENLDADQHDTLMQTVESSSGQEAFEFATVMQRTRLPDGRNMLAAFHSQGKMVKLPTTSVEMTPDRNTTILLSELNEIIAQQRGVTVGDLAITDSSATQTQTQTQTQSNEPVTETVTDDNNVLSDDALAAKYRSDADRLFKEAKRLREQAEELSPTKKKKKTEEESA